MAVRGLGHRYGGPPPVEALRDLDLQARAGEFLAVVGPSGCGKSTLLRVLAGLVVPATGTAHVDGEPCVGRPGLVAYQAQRDLLLPWRRVLDNTALGAQVAGMPRRDARLAAAGVLDRFGLAPFARAWPASLSGGMRQRVALLRTFLVPRPVLVLDEPLGALDALTRREVQAWLQEVWAADGRTVVLVTHDVEEAVLLADRVVVMSPRPGRIVHEEMIGLARPRLPAAVTEPDFVAHKRALLSALGA